jgi:hypothetical protein
MGSPLCRYALPTCTLKIRVKIVEDSGPTGEPVFIGRVGHRQACDESVDTRRFLALELFILEINVVDDL